MKKLIPFAVLSIAACTPTQTADLTKVVDAVQKAAVITCKFVPTATTVANIISAGSAAVPSQIADTICAAVTTSSITQAFVSEQPVVVVNGKTVTVEGHFVR
jgi:hypothetical protein